MPFIRQFLDLTTAHLAPADRTYLDSCVNFGKGLPAYQTTYGWFVYATDDPDWPAELPPHIRHICAHARAHGCEYILFDADSVPDPELPIFDYDTGAEIPDDHCS